jgi:hypothetical protein
VNWKEYRDDLLSDRIGLWGVAIELAILVFAAWKGWL